MRPDAPKLLEDVCVAGRFILRHTAGKTLEAYEADEVLRSAVERKFEIIGEALNRLRRADPDTADRLPDIGQIIAFRNILAHGYDAILPSRVWAIIQNSLPSLLVQIEAGIKEQEGAR